MTNSDSPRTNGSVRRSPARDIRDGAQIVSRPNDQDRADPERLTQTYLEQVHANQKFRDIAEFLGSVRYLHLVPQLGT